MSAAAKPFHEPAENEFVAGDLAATAAPLGQRADALYAGLLNGLLDQIADSVQRALDHGLEAELRTRLSLLLPPVTTPTARSASSLGKLGVDQVNELIELLHCVQALSEHARRAKPGSAAAQRDTTCANYLRGRIERIKRGEA